VKCLAPAPDQAYSSALPLEESAKTTEGRMPTKAYILIKVKAGKTKDVVKALKKVAGVEQVHSCFGQPDIFSFVNVPDEKSLSDVVITKVHTIEGVEETDTHIVADA
jgi:DNA-binding Lrp family transcriptional regulator